MKIEIKPLVGINEIKFGSSQERVIEILGEAARIEIDNVMRETREQRMGMIFRYIGDELKDVIMSEYVEAYIFDLPIFQTDNLIEKLSKYDEPTEEIDGYVNFYNIGLSLGGFGNGTIPEGRLATAFSKDRVQFYKYFLEA